MWVDLQIKNICDPSRSHTEADTEADVRVELGKLPKDLGETYAQIFQKIKPYLVNSQRLVMKTVSWIMCAQGPLSPNEIIRVISDESESNGNTAKVPNVDEGTVLRFCHNLVI